LAIPLHRVTTIVRPVVTNDFYDGSDAFATGRKSIMFKWLSIICYAVIGLPGKVWRAISAISLNAYALVASTVSPSHSPRKRKAMQNSNGPKFAVGSIVRVRQNRTDVGYPDRPFGGWVGRVIEVQEDVCTTCLVRWSQETLAAISPFFEHRCEGDGMGFRETWLDEDDMEYYDWHPMPVEQPTGTPNWGDGREARLRSVFGLFSGDALPRACRDALLTYYEHFAAWLSFPFDGDFQQGTEPLPGPRCVTVVRLLQKAGVNESDGILCGAVTDKGARGVPLAAVRVVPNSANSQLIADYCYWWWNYR